MPYFLKYPIARWLFSKILNFYFPFWYFLLFFDDKIITIRLHSKVDATWIAASPANCSIVYKSEKMFTSYKKRRQGTYFCRCCSLIWSDRCKCNVVERFGEKSLKWIELASYFLVIFYVSQPILQPILRYILRLPTKKFRSLFVDWSKLISASEYHIQKSSPKVRFPTAS